VGVSFFLVFCPLWLEKKNIKYNFALTTSVFLFFAMYYLAPPASFCGVKKKNTKNKEKKTENTH